MNVGKFNFRKLNVAKINFENIFFFPTEPQPITTLWYRFLGLLDRGFLKGDRNSEFEVNFFIRLILTRLPRSVALNVLKIEV